MAKEEQIEQEVENKSKLKIHFKLILLIGFMLINGVLVIIGVFLVYSSIFGHKKPAISEADLKNEVLEKRESEPIELLVYTMETFNTNLDGIPKRLIKLQVNLEMLDEAGFEEIVSHEAKARNAIINILNAKTFPEIESIQGKLHLKNQIINQLNGFLENGIVKGVYFSKFAIQ